MQRIKRKNNNVKLNFNVDKLIKNNPAYVYMAALVIGFVAAFSVLLTMKTVFNLEIEKKGTYLYYNDYWNNINSNFVQKEIFNNMLQDNNKLKDVVEKYRSKNTDLIISEIRKQEIKRDQITKELIDYTTGMSVAFDGNNKSINTETEKYRQMKADLDKIRELIKTLYEKL